MRLSWSWNFVCVFAQISSMIAGSAHLISSLHIARPCPVPISLVMGMPLLQEQDNKICFCCNFGHSSDSICPSPSAVQNCCRPVRYTYSHICAKMLRQREGERREKKKSQCHLAQPWELLYWSPQLVEENMSSSDEIGPSSSRSNWWLAWNSGPCHKNHAHLRCPDVGLMDRRVFLLLSDVHSCQSCLH